jgi:hypothetical protein
VYQNQGQDSDDVGDRIASAEQNKVIRPHRTAPGLRHGASRPLVYKSLPDLQQEQLTSPDHHREDSLIDLSPIGDRSTQDRFYSNTGEVTASHVGGAANLQASASSLLDLPVEEPEELAWKSQTYSNDFLSVGGGGYSFASSTFIASSEYSHDSSFNSLPDGATYHEPPGEEEEEQDPFDTSSVVVNSSAASSNSNNNTSQEANNTTADKNGGRSVSAESGGAPGQNHHQLSDSENSFENRRSIISQLLASHPAPAGAPSPFTAFPNAVAEGRNGRRAPTLAEGGAEQKQAGPRQRTVSAVSEPDTFGGSLLPLTSPFSPPAFNPYDVVLGPNETIAGNNFFIRHFFTKYLSEMIPVFFPN